MSKVRPEDIHHWLREAAEETVPASTDSVPQQHQHAQHASHDEEQDDGSSNTD